MSDIMLHGVLNMPMPDDPAELDLVTWMQFKDRARQASQQIEALQARLAEVEAALERAQSLFEPRNGDRWVTPDMIEYGYEWMGWLASDRPLVPIDDLRAVQDALATARRDALQSVLDNIREWAWPEDGTYPPEDQAIQNAERGTVEFIESQIREMKDAKP
jgi:hypothetical protein